MIGKKMIATKPVPIVEVKKMLADVKKDRETLTYEQNVSLEYAKEFAAGTPAKVEKAIAQLTELGMDERLAVKMIDVLPKTREDVELVFEKERFPLTEEKIKKIVDIVATIE